MQVRSLDQFQSHEGWSGKGKKTVKFSFVGRKNMGSNVVDLLVPILSFNNQESFYLFIVSG